MPHAQDEKEKKKPRSVTPNAGLKTRIITEETNIIIADYNNLFGGKPGHSTPKCEGDAVILKFPHKGNAENFCIDAAKKGISLAIVDSKTNTVMGYSNGDGTLYHVDGTVFEKNDTLHPSEIAQKDFELPSLSSKWRI